MEARDEDGAWFQCLPQLATQSPADGMLEETHGRLQVGGMVCRTRQEWEAPRDRPIEGSEPAGQHRMVAHRIEELDLKRIRVAACHGGGHGLGGRAMARAGVRKEKEVALRGGHDRPPAPSEQPFGGAYLLARSNRDWRARSFEHSGLRRGYAAAPFRLWLAPGAGR